MQNRLIAGILSLYLASFFYTQVPFVKVLTLVKGSDQLFWNHIAIFVIFFIPILFILTKYIDSYSRGGILGYIKTVLLFIAFIGIIISILYNIIPVAPVYTLPAVLDKFFLPDISFTLWLLVPIAVMVL